jgi:threonine dehydrogenase-like Zn-dependent dehydrogenase
LKSSRATLPEDIKKIIRLMQAGLINIDGIITHRLKFESLTDRFTELYNPDQQVIKAVIEY